jgi:hypothetical protein
MAGDGQYNDFAETSMARMMGALNITLFDVVEMAQRIRAADALAANGRSALETLPDSTVDAENAGGTAQADMV